MAIDATFPVPEAISFEQAIQLTQSLLASMAQGQVDEEQARQTIAALVASPNGARGFFVTYSTLESLPDQPAPAVLAALQTSPDIVSELLVKNLAMSTAMQVFHQRNHHPELARDSERVQHTTLQLIAQMQMAIVQIKLQQLLESVTTDAGPYQSFLDRWGYDAEQRIAIQQVLQRVIT